MSIIKNILKNEEIEKRIEKVIESKGFSIQIKNLLYSALTKLDNKYDEYIKVKRMAERKDIFFMRILQNLEEIENIEFLDIKHGDAFNLTLNIIDKENKSIKIIPNELSLIYSLIKYNKEEFYVISVYSKFKSSILNSFLNEYILPEEYEKIFQDLLNEGMFQSRLEAYLDFDGWGWTSSKKSRNIENIYIYILSYLLSFDDINLGNIYSKLKEKYGMTNAKNIYSWLITYIYIYYKENEGVLKFNKDEDFINMINLEKIKTEEKIKYFNSSNFTDLNKDKKIKLEENILNIETVLQNQHILKKAVELKNENCENVNQHIKVSEYKDKLKEQKNKLTDNLEYIKYIEEKENYEYEKDMLDIQKQILDNIIEIFKHIYNNKNVEKENKNKKKENINIETSFHNIFKNMEKNILNQISNSEKIILKLILDLINLKNSNIFLGTDEILNEIYILRYIRNMQVSKYYEQITENRYNNILKKDLQLDLFSDNTKIDETGVIQIVNVEKVNKSILSKKEEKVLKVESVPVIKKEISKLMLSLIIRLIQEGILRNISNNIDLDSRIYLECFKSKIINFKDIHLEIYKTKTGIISSIYNKEAFYAETEINTKIDFNINIKEGKIVKIFRK